MPLFTALLLLFATAVAPTHSPATAAHVRVGAAPSEAASRAGKPLKALQEWLRSYRKGKIDVISRADQDRKSLARKYDLIEGSTSEVLTHRRDLELILAAVAAVDSPDAAELLLEVAAIGLDDGRIDYTYEMAPHAVRQLGEASLGKLRSDESVAYLNAVAKGEEKVDKAYGDGMRAAAVRLLGTRKSDAAREQLHAVLADASVPVRLAATEALGNVGSEQSIETLAQRLKVETEESVVISLVRALRQCLHEIADKAGTGDKAPSIPQSARLAIEAAAGALGRASWRADMQLVTLLADFRSATSVPALIAVLQRFADNPADVASGKLSGLLLHRAHEALVAMTGAVYSAEKPQQWREFWEREQANILAQAPKPRREELGKVAVPGDDTAVKGFFGIPVQGTRVLFVVDLSGSMQSQMTGGTTTDGAAPAETRLDYAKRELLGAIEKLPENTLMNIITYNGNPKAKSWAKDMVEANKKNKDRASKFISEMRADGGTNMWAGLQSGLLMKSLVYGERYDSNVDELFILSDGAPTVGEIIDPLEIRRLVTETNRFSGVRINTIFITSRNGAPNPAGTSLTPSELMRTMAEQNGGKFIEIRD